MNYALDIDINNLGGYLSSEQIDLLSIIQAKDIEELLNFIKNSNQLQLNDINIEKLKNMNLEEAKKEVFKLYQDTLVSHYSPTETILDNMLSRSLISKEDIEIIKRVYSSKSEETLSYIREYIKNKYPNNYEEIFKFVHRFTSLERDQNKASDLYEELVLLNQNLNSFDTLLIGSLKPESIINELFPSGENRYDFSKELIKDLEFARINNKHVRLHSLLTKGSNESIFKGKTKEEILSILKEYVTISIDFINNYNNTHSLNDGSKVINAVDLFNEIVSFDKNENNEYYNIWEKYGISIEDICEVFNYAKINKPEGVEFIYNEPFLEDDKRRKKVIEVLTQINQKSPGLIDSLGSQMHITIDSSSNLYDKYKDGVVAFLQEYAKNYGVSEEKINSILMSKEATLEILKDEIEKSTINVTTFQNIVCGGETLIFGTTEDAIKRSLTDLKKLQDSTGVGLQITEFDSSLSTNEAIRTFKKGEIPLEKVYEIKKEQIKNASQIIKESNVKLNGISYWSLTDKIDCNLERIRETLLKKGIIKDIREIPTAFGGLLPTDYAYLMSIIENNMDNESTIKL